ncbi:MAG TPA: RcnB family protein [Rhizomicrobium sp.]
MKHTLLSATALALILSVPAFAAPHDHGDQHDQGTPTATPDTGGHGHSGGGHPEHGASGGGGAGRTHHDNGAGAAVLAAPTGGTHHRGGNGSGGATTNNPLAGGGTTGGTHHRGQNNGGTNGGAATILAPAGGGGRAGTHAGRGHNSAFDALRRAFNAPRHFHHGTYHRPSGWYAHRWNYGEFLPALFYSRSYWISDYNDFDLNDPPPGTVWVRYGDDALLIDEDSGEVIQVEYGIFY